MTLPLKWHGGKSYLAKRIVALMPPHIHYVEPYAGGLAVLLEREPQNTSELVNDINGELTNFWRVLQGDESFNRFRRIVEATPLSRNEFDNAQTPCHVDNVDNAVRFFVRCRQSRAGTFKGFTSITRSRLRRGINGNASEWIGAVDGLPAVHARLRAVVIENLPAIDIIRREATFHTLFYLDPPYLHETRVSTDAYAFEMSELDHIELLHVITSTAAKYVLSGYRSDLYDTMLSHWNRHDFDMPNHAAGGTIKRRMTECVWCNF